MTVDLSALPRLWWSVELPGIRPHPRAYATYSAFDTAALPPIERSLDGDLAWLFGEPTVPGSLGETTPGDPEPSGEATGDTLDRLVAGQAISLPPAFDAFIRSPEPRRRIRSATACYLDLAEILVPVAGGGVLVHFLSDQQWALHWLLFAGADGSEAVLATDQPLGFTPESGPAAVDELDPSALIAAVCAETFEEFLYRYRIENEIWFALADPAGGRRELTAEEARYVDHYRHSRP